MSPRPSHHESNVLALSDELALPLDTVTDTIGILAIKGAGKTYTFLKLVEQMVKAVLPVVVLDVVGVCWGLRSSADGKHAGMPVIIIGGVHGDVPLEEGAGAILADWVLSARRPAVLDLSDLPTKAAMLRFSLDFLSRLYQAAKREPIHVVLDEADEFCPQRPFGEEARLVRAVEVLVRRGRAKGIGVTMVTQRPAVLSKNVLTQIGTLIVGRTVSPQDRKAVEEWVDAHATAEQKKVFLTSLASLPTREKWVWSPARDVFARVAIGERETFDSSATPKVGEIRVEPRELAPVELDALRARIAATIEKAKHDDPKALRARIAELERELASRPSERVEVEKIVYMVPEQVLEAAPRLKMLTARVAEEVDRILAAAGDARPLEFVTDPAPARAEQTPAKLAPVRAAEPTPASSTRARPAPEVDLGKQSGPRRVLIALAQLGPLPRKRLAIVSGYNARGGAFAKVLREGLLAGVVGKDESDRWHLSTKGRAELGPFEPLPRGRALLEYWRAHIGDPPARRILEELARVHPDKLSRSALAQRTGYSVRGGAYAKPLRLLRGFGLISGSREIGLSRELADAIG